jgi:hypothetical protein
MRDSSGVKRYRNGARIIRNILELKVDSEEISKNSEGYLSKQ